MISTIQIIKSTLKIITRLTHNTCAAGHPTNGQPRLHKSEYVEKLIKFQLELRHEFASNFLSERTSNVYCGIGACNSGGGIGGEREGGEDGAHPELGPERQRDGHQVAPGAVPPHEAPGQEHRREGEGDIDWEVDKRLY